MRCFIGKTVLDSRGGCSLGRLSPDKRGVSPLGFGLATLEFEATEGVLNEPVGTLVAGAFLQKHELDGPVAPNPEQEGGVLEQASLWGAW
jgi:hypothetical protein